jgi:hypothetical protein
MTAVLISAVLVGCGEEQGLETKHNVFAAAPDAYLTEETSAWMLRPGETFEVRLRGEGGASQGPPWKLAAAFPSVRLDGADVILASPGTPGAGKTWVFRFAAITEGEGRLVFTRDSSARHELGVVVAHDVIHD